MKRLSSIQKMAIAFLMAFTVAVPVVLAQSTEGEQGRKMERRGGQDRQGMKRGGVKLRSSRPATTYTVTLPGKTTTENV